MVLDKNIGGCLWNMIKNDDETFYERDEHRILWRCDIPGKELTIIPIDVDTAEGKLLILYSENYKDEESFMATCSYFCGIKTENDYHQRNKNILSKRKKFYAKLKGSTIWVCEFDNRLYAIFTVSNKGDVELISEFLLSIGEALYQGEKYFKQFKPDPIYIKELIKSQIKIETTKEYLLSPKIPTERDITIREFSSDTFKVVIKYNYESNGLSIISPQSYKNYEATYPYESKYETIDLQNGKTIFIFKLITAAYAVILIEKSQYEDGENKITILNPKELASTHVRAIDICCKYMKQKYPDKCKVVCHDFDGHEVKWLE